MRATGIWALAVFITTCASVVVALDNGLALVPPMAYSVWFDGSATTTSGCMNDSMLRSTADAMAANGLLAAGYDTFGLDCYWTTGRDSNGTWIPDPTIFTEGLPSLLDYLRLKGFKVNADAGEVAHDHTSTHCDSMSFPSFHRSGCTLTAGPACALAYRGQEAWDTKSATLSTLQPLGQTL